MAEPINEIIQVGAVFRGGEVRPAWFDWRRRRYAVKTVTLRWLTREGRSPILHLGVTDSANCFELTFNQDTLVWRLASVETSD